MATKNKTAKRRVKKSTTRKSKATKKKAGVKNSLVNNINKRKRKGISRSKKKSTISDGQYNDLQHNWGKSRSE